MCRYEFSRVLTHYVCTACRIGFKGVSICPTCKGEMTAMGLDFKIPPRNNKRQWRKIKVLLDVGLNFSSGCGCGGPGYAPRTLLDAKDYAEAHQAPLLNRNYTKKERNALQVSKPPSRKVYLRINRRNPYKEVPNKPL